MKIRIKSIILLALAFVWIAIDLWMIVGNVILRETRLGVIAAFLDRLPSEVANPIFIFLDLGVLFGWIVPLTLGLIGLLRRRRSAKPTA